MLAVLGKVAAILATSNRPVSMVVWFMFVTVGQGILGFNLLLVCGSGFYTVEKANDSFHSCEDDLGSLEGVAP